MTQIATEETENKAPQKKKPGNRKVADRKGTVYTLTGKVGEGGQGMVCKTDLPGVLIKIQTDKNPSKKKEWAGHIKWLMRQDFTGLKIARPLETIARPASVNGYVMELMDGLEPLEKSLEHSFLQLAENEEDSLQGYRNTGGLKRRLMLLAELARTLAGLHAKGLAYGDLSPANIFVSESVDHHQLWLIDCDNICISERAGHGDVHTVGYAAPEVVKGESGVNMATDSWSFAIIAMKFLSHTHPFESGVAVEDGDPDVEMKRAMEGELPWIYDEIDESNAWARSGLPLEIVTTKLIRCLFHQCFGLGRTDLSARPSMAGWADAFEAACALMHECCNPDCRISFIYNENRACPFCDTVQPEYNSVVLKHYFMNDTPVPDEPRWIKTNEVQVINIGQTVDFHIGAVGTELYRESPKVCTLELKDSGLIIKPSQQGSVALQQDGGKQPFQIKRQHTLKPDMRSGKAVALHIHMEDHSGFLSHPVWTFIW